MGVLLNLPSGIVPLFVRFAYALAMVCTFPLQLLPATRLVEGIFFDKAIAKTMSRTMRKNLFRTIFVLCLCAVAIVGSTSLDHYISITGAACGFRLPGNLPPSIVEGPHE